MSFFQAKSEFVSHSVLSPLLPEAAIFYLEEYGAEKYAQVFLGEFDNPEIIWNTEMRYVSFESFVLTFIKTDEGPRR